MEKFSGISRKCITRAFFRALYNLEKTQKDRLFHSLPSIKRERKQKWGRDTKPRKAKLQEEENGREDMGKGSKVKL